MPQAPFDDQAPAPLDYSCLGCGHGVAAEPPRQCPHCRGRAWARVSAAHLGDLEIVRLADTTYLLTPPPLIDAEVGTEICETVAALARERTEIVIDLTAVADVDGDAAKLLVKTSSLTHWSGARMFAVCPSARNSGFDLHDLDPHRIDSSAIHGALGRAFRRLDHA